MKVVNLISLLSAVKTVNPELLESYLKYHSVKIKSSELNDLEVFLKQLQSVSTNVGIFDKYYVGYSIPQIAKEFDLLRIDSKSVVNIELKRLSTQEKIKNQLVRNKYYLGFLKKELFLFSYIANEQKLYALDERENLIEIEFQQLIAVLVQQQPKRNLDIDADFNPSNYLISPFNSTEEFILSKYFLTNRQEEIKKTVLEVLSSPKYSILSIKGKAGTGKTLLTFDIAKDVSKTRKVLLVHCGIINQGHTKLRDVYGWDIIPAKALWSTDLSQFHLIILDEAQRIFLNQLTQVVREVKKLGNNCIFSYDEQQTLKKEEISSKLSEKIEAELTHSAFELTTKIRTNKEVASFIHCLIGKNRKIEYLKRPNIELFYFAEPREAVNFLNQIRTEDWKVINYTPDRKAKHEYELHKILEESDNAHTVIGQEFDNVVAVIDEFFYYKRGLLSTKNYERGPFYHPTKMFFQIVSRTRNKLCIVVINNNEIFERCLEILNYEPQEKEALEA